MILSKEKLQAYCAGALSFHGALVEAFDRFRIDTRLREIHFLAQAAHESDGFHRLVENLNYSAQGLANTWPTRFAVDPKARVKVLNALAASLHRKPEAIANVVYANRMGNGDAASGDGWRYRGRGVGQLTGLDNYLSCSLALYGDRRLAEHPELLEQPRDAVASFAWFWDTRQLNALADQDNGEAITKRINGGLNGYDDHDRSDLDTRVDWILRGYRIL